MCLIITNFIRDQLKPVTLYCLTLELLIPGLAGHVANGNC
jgi:hypothetical protein